MAKWTPPWANGSDMAFVPVGLANQGVTFAQYEQGNYEDRATPGAHTLTDDEVERVLSGDYGPLNLTAAAADIEEAGESTEEQTGAMIALLPTEEDMNRLVVDGGEEDEELHLTLCYLGDAAKIPPRMRNDIIDAVRMMSKNLPIVDADAFGVAAFNQEDAEKDPCVVLLVSGEEVAKAHMMAMNAAQDCMNGECPEQHEPWTPHVTLAYTSDANMVQQLGDREGPIRFDHVRVAFGGEVTDFPLYDGTAKLAAVEESPVEDMYEYEDEGLVAADISTKIREKAAKKGHAMPDGSFPIRNVSDLHNAIQSIGRAKNPAAVKAFIKRRAQELNAKNAIPAGWEVDVTLAKESDVNMPGGSHNLKAYWTHGEGAAKIGWGTNGSFARCVAQLGKYVKKPEGLCAEYHHAATGEWPTEGGKHGIPSAVDIVALESESVVADAAVDLEAELGEYDGGWEGTLMVEDSDTGDGRMFSGGSVTWGDTNETIHPLQWAASNLGEHKGSVTVGRIDKIWRNPDNPRRVMGKGRFNVNDPDGLRAFRQMRDGFAGGVSVDPDQVTDADVELEFALGEDESNPFAKPTKTIFHAGRLRGATLVAFPALVEAAIKLTKKGETSAVVASVSDEPWKAIEHEMRLGDTQEIDGLVASAAFAYVQDIDDFVTRQQCRFLHHEIDENGRPGRASLVACAKHIDAINTGRSFGLTNQQLRLAYDHMAQHFTDAGRDAPAFTLEVESVVAAGVPSAAPLAWFGQPELSGPTPVTVTPEGRVFGHAACWGTCHTGFADTCVTPPHETDYSYFTTGEVLTAEGHSVAVGQITLGTSHAATHGITLARAIDHYGDTGTAVADVTAGTDEHGIWIAGAVRPGVSDEQLHALRASALSGDWRRIAGSLRMVALLAVNVPGFPIPRVGTALAKGKQVSLVAAGVVDRTAMSIEDELAALDFACGIKSATKKPKLKYASLEAELAELDNF